MSLPVWKQKIHNTDGAPNCPRCGSRMERRKGERGSFWGCIQFPRCRGTLQPNVEVNRVAPITKLPGSPEQEAIWEAGLNGKTHLIVDAVAGSGKSWTMVQLCLRIPKTKKVGSVAFNRHIAKELGDKLRASKCSHVTCRTAHSFGLRFLTHRYHDVEVAKRGEKTRKLIADLFPDGCKSAGIPEEAWQPFSSAITRLTSLAKTYLVDFESEGFVAQMEELVIRHEVELGGFAGKAMEAVRIILHKSLPIEDDFFWADYDDFIWVPVIEKLQPAETFDVLIIDELQDWDVASQQLALRLCPKGRIIGVGDRNQSIYGFKGADIHSIPRMQELLGKRKRGVKLLPLTVTRRCPKSHVSMVQGIVPQIQAMDSAPEGVVTVTSPSQAITLMRPNDMVLCRINAKLIPTAFGLIKRGVPVVVRGHDIGEQLVGIVRRLQKEGAATLPELSKALDEWFLEEKERLEAFGEKARSRIINLRDRKECLEEFIFNSGATSIEQLKHKIELLFAEEDEEGKVKDAVILGTVHRTKGLEANRVFILAPELIPFPNAKQKWEQQQEMNLAYVAATRAKYEDGQPGELVFCGSVPDVYRYEGVTPYRYQEHEAEDHQGPAPVPVARDLGPITLLEEDFLPGVPVGRQMVLPGLEAKSKEEEADCLASNIYW